MHRGGVDGHGHSQKHDHRHRHGHRTSTTSPSHLCYWKMLQWSPPTTAREWRSLDLLVWILAEVMVEGSMELMGLSIISRVMIMHTVLSSLKTAWLGIMKLSSSCDDFCAPCIDHHRQQRVNQGWVVRVDALRTLRHGWCSTLDVRFQRCGILLYCTSSAWRFGNTLFLVARSTTTVFASINRRWTPVVHRPRRRRRHKGRGGINLHGVSRGTPFQWKFPKDIGVPEFRVRAISRGSALVKQALGICTIYMRTKELRWLCGTWKPPKDLQMIRFRVSQLEWLQSRSTRWRSYKAGSYIYKWQCVANLPRKSACAVNRRSTTDLTFRMERTSSSSTS